jgi:calcineurin-like phosphoesterase family protein
MIKIFDRDNFKHQVFISHYPHAYWPSSHHGSFHFYGHCHTQREETLDQVFPGRRSIDVGVDNAALLFNDYIPLSERCLIDYLIQQPGHDPVSFYEKEHP